MSLPLQSPPIARRRAGLSPSDACLGATVNNQGQVCVNTPFGSICIPISTPLPPGTNVQACISTCNHIVPTGACVTLSYNGATIGQQCEGWC
jgi:hypothetical protein